MRRKGRCCGPHPGFTLIELLTVMAIISVLLAILLPGLSGARRSSRVTKCQANLRELAHATLRYVSENDDSFPVAADCSEGDCVFWNGQQYFGWNGTMPNPAGKIWLRPVNAELGLSPAPPSSSLAKVAECPSDIGAPGETGVKGRTLFEVMGTSYPLNPILCQGNYNPWRYRDKGIGASQILQPSRKVLVFDHPAFGLTFDGHWTAIRPGWHDKLRPAAVVGFIDGHVDYLKGLCSLREWQWYGEASGPDYTFQLPKKVNWTVRPGCE